MVNEPSFQPSEPSSDARLREQIAQHLSDQSWMDAIECHEQLTECLAEDHWKVARAYLALRRVQKALPALKASLKLASSGPAHALMAALHADEPDPANQRVALGHALRAARCPDCPEEGFVQALASLERRCRRGLSFMVARRGCKRFPESAILQRALADGCYHRGEFERAYRILDATLDSNAPPKLVEFAHRCAMMAGDWPGAIKQGERLAPTCAWLFLGDAHAGSGDTQEAVANYEQGLRSERRVDHFLAHVSCASALAVEDSARSLQHLLQAGKLLPHLPQRIVIELGPGVSLRLDRMELLRRLTAGHLPGGASAPLPASLGSGGSTLARLAAYAALNPETARDWRLRAAEQHLPVEHAPQAMRDYLGDRRYREAWEAFWLAAWRGARAQGPHDLEGWDHTWPLDPACVLELYRGVLEAVTSAASAGEGLEPALLDASDLSSKALWFGRMFSELVALSKSVLRCAPENPRAWRCLAQAQQELGCVLEAKASYEQLLALVPGDRQATISHAQLCDALKAYGHVVRQAPVGFEELQGPAGLQTQGPLAGHGGVARGVCGEGVPRQGPPAGEEGKAADPLPSNLPLEFSASGSLPLRTRLYLAALLEHGCSPDGEIMGSLSISGERKLSPTRSHDRRLVLTLQQQGWIAPHPHTPMATRGGHGYPLDEVCWQLDARLRQALGDRALDCLRETLNDFENAEATNLWGEIAVQECIEYLIRVCGQYHWNFGADEWTRSVLSRLLAHESTAQVQAHIHYVCKTAAAEELRHRYEPQEAVRQLVSRIHQRSQRGFGVPFSERYYLKDLSTLSRLFHDRVLGIGAAQSYGLCPAVLPLTIRCARAS